MNIYGLLYINQYIENYNAIQKIEKSAKESLQCFKNAEPV